MKKVKFLFFEIKKQNKLKIEKRKGLDQANLVFAHHVPLSADKRHYAAYVLNCLMTGGMSSRLFYQDKGKKKSGLCCERRFKYK